EVGALGLPPLLHETGNALVIGRDFVQFADQASALLGSLSPLDLGFFDVCLVVFLLRVDGRCLDGIDLFEDLLCGAVGAQHRPRRKDPPAQHGRYPCAFYEVAHQMVLSQEIRRSAALSSSEKPPYFRAASQSSEGGTAGATVDLFCAQRLRGKASAAR